jgi:hypothetical protein
MVTVRVIRLLCTRRMLNEFEGTTDEKRSCGSEWKLYCALHLLLHGLSLLFPVHVRSHHISMLYCALHFLLHGLSLLFPVHVRSHYVSMLYCALHLLLHGLSLLFPVHVRSHHVSMLYSADVQISAQ